MGSRPGLDEKEITVVENLLKIHNLASYKPHLFMELTTLIN